MNDSIRAQLEEAVSLLQYYEREVNRLQILVEQYEQEAEHEQ